MKKTIKVADKPTLDEVSSKLDSVRQDIKGVETNITGSLTGEASAFGTGVLGDVVYSEEFIYPSKDYYGRYILLCKNFTLPEGIIMTPPENCNGLYIYCQGTCTINGTIDMRGKRLTLDSDNGISNFIKVGEVQYPLAVGGHTVKGGNSGKAGKVTFSTGSKFEWYKIGTANDNVYAGNINGGGTSTYGLVGKADKDIERQIDTTGNYLVKGTLGRDGKTSEYRQATGAVIILASKIIINGIINCSGLEGVPCENIGENGKDCRVNHGGGQAWWRTYWGSAGDGGNGAQAPTGGGCITILTYNFINNGQLLTNGSNLTCTGTAVGENDSVVEDSEYKVYAAGGTAGGGGTFISQAGEIKIHIIAE